MRKLILRFLNSFINSVLYPSDCPRVQAGFTCHKDSPKYNYECECGRRGKLYDPEIIKRSK